jgi:Kef-type K+ transport system membrane component KefB
MHYFVKPLIRALRHMNDRELKLSVILGFLLFFAGLIELLRLLEL